MREGRTYKLVSCVEKVNEWKDVLGPNPFRLNMDGTSILPASVTQCTVKCLQVSQ